MKKFFVDSIKYLISMILWIIWWLVATCTVLLLIIISLTLPKRVWDNFVTLSCKIMLYCLLLFPRVKGEKLKNLPFPAIYVANHVSFFDLFIAGSVLPGKPRGLEINSHFYTPVYGWFITRFGQISIERGNVSSIRTAIRRAEYLLKNRERSIYIAPEGTRTKDGKIGNFGSGAFFLSIKSGIPIVPVVYKGLYEKNNKNHILINSGFFDIVILPPIYPNKFDTHEKMLQYTREQMIKELNNKGH